MLAWIAENANVLRLAVSIATVGVWIAYLQLFLMSYLRQSTPVILISRGASPDEQARCLITNMSSEPIYVSDVIAEISVEGETRSALVTDREEIGLSDVSHPRERTNQGPLASGDFLDIGSFADILHRAEQRTGLQNLPGRTSQMTLTVAAASGRASRIVAACRAYCVEHDENGTLSFRPRSLIAKQIRRGRRRRRLLRQLERELR
jgi:hypothetical protein